MNAYEMADELENKDRLWNVDENLMLKNCAMLRQQADRIAELQEVNGRFADLIQSLREEVDKLRKESK